MVKACLVFILSIFFISCGPEQTASDRDRDQYDRTTQKNIKIKQDELRPLVGVYSGKIRYSATGREELATLELYLSTVFVTSPGRNEMTEVPTIAGQLISYKGEEINLDKTSHTFTFTQGVYSPTSGKFSLYSDAAGVKTQLDADFDNPEIVGRISTSLVGNTANFQMSRIQ